MYHYIRIYLVLIIACVVNGNYKTNFLFELTGRINDCSCDIDIVDQFNNAKIYPRISSLVLKDYFRFYKVNLRKECPYWKDGSHCGIRFCQVESCNEESIPEGIKYGRKTHHENENMSLKYTEAGQDFDCHEIPQQDLGFLNTTISVSSLEEFALWQAYDNAQDLFCRLPDEDNDAQYVDLQLNPERYTGFKGESAHKIWHVIYKENCFRPENIYEVYIRSSKLTGMCLEKRAFYRVISGLHASINIHLSAKYLLSDKNSNILSCNTGVWGPNINELNKKFAPEHTNSEGPQWIRNLYFVYLLELRALVKASAYLEQEEYYTGSEKEDSETRKAIKNFLLIAKEFPYHFNESVMFKETSLYGKSLKEEFRLHFRNITTIMDCVGCDKCKLWGKLQIQGLGTALKILFSDRVDKLLSSNAPLSRKGFQLERSEIIALFNAFARLSTSIYELENFRNLMR